MSNSRAEATRAAWLDTMARYRHDPDGPGGDRMWSPRLDAASPDELRAIQDVKIAAVAPFLYENSPFYRRRFDRLGLASSIDCEYLARIGCADRLDAWRELCEAAKLQGATR